jgi:hypothetical protein
MGASTMMQSPPTMPAMKPVVCGSFRTFTE